MVFPENRFNDRNRYKPRKKLNPLIIVLGLIFISGIAFVIIKFDSIKNLITPEPSAEESILQLWERNQYTEINALCEEILLDDPLNEYALVFNGFSYFFRGDLQFSIEEKLPLFRKAVTNLRKTLIINSSYMHDSVLFILGKSYFNLGKYYMDSAIYYLEEALAQEYEGDDRFEYLGMAYYNIGNYKKCLEAFHQAYDLKPTDTISLSLAQTYFSLEDFNSAEEYLLRTLNQSSNFNILQKSRFLLGNLYLQTEDYIKAEKYFREILEENPQSADSHYFLGEIYSALGDTIKARNEWRDALRIDPNHHGSKLRLYN